MPRPARKPCASIWRTGRGSSLWTAKPFAAFSASPNPKPSLRWRTAATCRRPSISTWDLKDGRGETQSAGTCLRSFAISASTRLFPEGEAKSLLFLSVIGREKPFPRRYGVRGYPFQRGHPATPRQEPAPLSTRRQHPPCGPPAAHMRHPPPLRRMPSAFRTAHRKNAPTASRLAASALSEILSGPPAPFAVNRKPCAPASIPTEFQTATAIAALTPAAVLIPSPAAKRRDHFKAASRDVLSSCIPRRECPIGERTSKPGSLHRGRRAGLSLGAGASGGGPSNWRRAAPRERPRHRRQSVAAMGADRATIP